MLMAATLIKVMGFIYLAFITGKHGSQAGKVAMLVAVIHAVYASAQIDAFGNALPEALMLLISNIALFIGLPLAIIIVAHHYFGKRYFNGPWQAATWGRLFLGLTVVFELTRRNQLTQDYLTYLNYSWLILVIGCFLLFRKTHTRIQNILLLSVSVIGLLSMLNYINGTSIEPTNINQLTILIVLFSVFWGTPIDAKKG